MIATRKLPTLGPSPLSDRPRVLLRLVSVFLEISQVSYMLAIAIR